MEIGNRKSEIGNRKSEIGKNGGLFELVNQKVKVNLHSHPSLARGTKTTNSGRDFFPRSLNKFGMTSPSRIFNLIGLLKYAQARKNNSKSRIIQAGFTLVEIAIVIVIIGLIAGSILVGKDLISAAEVRSQISQIEKYNTAVNTFRIEYGYLPGDIPDPTASAFGFKARGTWGGEGDNNGIIEGNCGCSACKGSFCQSVGESTMFWVDLGTASLIENNFSAAVSHNAWGSTYTKTTTPNIASFLPPAKIGKENYIYVTSFNYENRLNISVVSSIDPSGYLSSSTGLTANQAFQIDKKIDDGLPMSGKTTAQYLDFSLNNWRLTWAGGGSMGVDSGWPNYSATTSATPASATTCYDNGNIAGATQQYSVGTNGGNSQNCALSIKFQ